MIFSILGISPAGIPVGNEPNIDELRCPTEYASFSECNIGIAHNGVCASTRYDALLICYIVPSLYPLVCCNIYGCFLCSMLQWAD